MFGSKMENQITSRSNSYALDAVQFAMPVFFCHEEDGYVSIDVMRVGQAMGRCSVTVSTQDGSARNSIKFIAKTQRVDFEHGELMKTIEIVLLDDNLFDTTLEFEVRLGSEEGCVLGSTLRCCRVLIDDDDLFPDTRFRDVIAKGEDAMCREVNGFILAYMQLVFRRVPTIWWKTVLTVIIDQLHNAYYICKVCIRIYLVDIVLTTELDVDDKLWIRGNKHLTAVLLAVAYVLPCFALMLSDRLKEGPLEMGKAIRTHFKVNLFRKYMNCTDDAKHEVPIQDMVGAMDGEIPALVDSCYMLVFELSREVGKVLIVGAFLLNSLGFHAIISLLLFPAASFFFLRSRQYMHVHLEDEVIEAEEDATGMLVNSVQGYRLIRDYRQRSSISMTFEEKLQRSYEVLTRLSVFKFWNHRFLPAVTVGGVALFLTLGTQLVLTRVISLGAFLAAVDMYQHLGDRFQVIQEHFEKVVQSGSALLQVTKILNLPTDFGERQRNALRRRRLMNERLASYAENGVPDGFPNAFDAMPIILEGVDVSYAPALTALNASVALGKLVYIYGPHGCGKRTLLHCIADRKAADSGYAVYASHNRVLQVSPDHVILQHLNLFENLSFGSASPQPERVMDIFSRMGLANNEELLAILQDNIDVAVGNRSTAREMTSRSQDAESQELLSGSLKPKRDRGHLKWQICLSAMEMHKLHLARAFVYNPQILVLHKPVDNADAGDEHDSLLGCLREFVDRRGVSYPVGSDSQRRPRTCFFSGGDHHSRSDKNSAASDVVWVLRDAHFAVEKGGVSRKITSDNITTSEKLGRGLSRSLTRQCSFDDSLLESQWEGGKTMISTWETTRAGVAVREVMSDAAPAHRILKLAAHVRGRKQQDWLALSGERGFVRISLATEEGVEKNLKRIKGDHAAEELHYEDSGVQCSMIEFGQGQRELTSTSPTPLYFWDDLASRGVPEIDVNRGSSSGVPASPAAYFEKNMLGVHYHQSPHPPRFPRQDGAREGTEDILSGQGQETKQNSQVSSARSSMSARADGEERECFCLFNGKRNFKSILAGSSPS